MRTTIVAAIGVLCFFPGTARSQEKRSEVKALPIVAIVAPVWQSDFISLKTDDKPIKLTWSRTTFTLDLTSAVQSNVKDESLEIKIASIGKVWPVFKELAGAESGSWTKGLTHSQMRDAGKRLGVRFVLQTQVNSLDAAVAIDSKLEDGSQQPYLTMQGDLSVVVYDCEVGRVALETSSPIDIESYERLDKNALRSRLGLDCYVPAITDAIRDLLEELENASHYTPDTPERVRKADAERRLQTGVRKNNPSNGGSGGHVPSAPQPTAAPSSPPTSGGSKEGGNG